MLGRPAVMKGRDVPVKSKLTEDLKKDPEALKKEEKHYSAIVQGGNKADADKHS